MDKLYYHRKYFYSALIVCLLFEVSCNIDRTDNKSKKDYAKLNAGEMKDDVFKKKVVVILAKELDKTSYVINIQDYILNGKSFIPVFSSVEKFNESTKGMVKNPKIEIDGMLFLSMLKGTETLKLNPGLDDEVTFHASELLDHYTPKMKSANPSSPSPK